MFRINEKILEIQKTTGNHPFNTNFQTAVAVPTVQSYKDLPQWNGKNMTMQFGARMIPSSGYFLLPNAFECEYTNFIFVV